MKKRFFYLISFNAIILNVSAFHVPLDPNKTTYNSFHLNTALRSEVSTDTSSAVVVSIKDIDSRLPNINLETEPFLFDALKYGS